MSLTNLGPDVLQLSMNTTVMDVPTTKPTSVQFFKYQSYCVPRRHDGHVPGVTAPAVNRELPTVNTPSSSLSTSMVEAGNTQSDSMGYMSVYRAIRSCMPCLLCT